MPRRSTRPTRRPVLLTVLAVVSLALSACSAATPDAATPPAVEVTGAAGSRPTLEYDKPLALPKDSQGAREIWPGEGAPIVDGGPVLLHMYAEDGRDGTVLQDTYADAPAWHTMSVKALGNNLHEALRGQKVGARLLFLEQHGATPLVLVVDVLPTRASGEAVAPVKGLPTVTLDDDGEPTVTIPKDAQPPADLVVQPLIRGTGPQVETGAVVTLRFTAVRWSDGQTFDGTWGVDPTTDDQSAVQSVMVGIGQVIEGWDQGLLEQSVGSQIMLVVPPALGYGGTTNPLADQTLVYVVDILDSHVQAVSEGAS